MIGVAIFVQVDFCPSEDCPSEHCPSDIIVQVTLLSKWQYCPSEYCPSDIIVQVNVFHKEQQKNFEDQQNLQKQRKSINCDKIYQEVSGNRTLAGRRRGKKGSSPSGKLLSSIAICLSRRT